MAKKETSPEVSKKAAKILAGEKKPKKADVNSVAGSALSQDETKGQRGKTATKPAAPKKPAAKPAVKPTKKK